jgi:hypothetical protein
MLSALMQLSASRERDAVRRDGGLGVGAVVDVGRGEEEASGNFDAE